MVKYYVATECTNFPSTNITLFRCHNYSKARSHWEKQVQTSRAHWKASVTSHICSEHFTPDCFKPDFMLAASQLQS